MRCVVVGPGALGLYLALRLARAPEAGPDSVVLLDHREDRARLLDREGVLLEEEDGTRHGRRIPCLSRATALSGGVDVLVFCVKSHALEQALADCAPLLDSGALPVALQNGIAHLGLMEGRGGALGVTTEGANLLGPGQVRHAGSGRTFLGLARPPGDGTSRSRLESLCAWLRAAGLDACLEEDIRARIWAKLFVNVGINALTAIHGRPNGHLLSSCSLRGQMKAAVNEAVAVARAEGVAVHGDPLRETFAVCRATRSNISSMLQDVRSGRPTEIGAINGAVVDLGRRHGIDCPVNCFLYTRVRAMEAGFPVSGERRDGGHA